MADFGLSENISEYMLSAFGEDFLNKYAEYVERDIIVYLRVSPLFDANRTIQNLNEYGIGLEPLNIIPNAYRVVKGLEKIGKTIDFTLGHYYIQSLSSMIPALVLNPTSDDVVLDLCAAPGSKTTQLAELMQNRGTLYANEPNLNRVKSLVFNFDKMTFANVAAIKHKGELLSKVFENYFDKILVDAPCSGLGILQKKGEVGSWWNLKQAEKIAELQFRLLVSALKMLKVGGELVYSTCTLTVEENEITLNKILRKYPIELQEIELPVPSHPAITRYHEEDLNPEIAKARRIIPWEVESEGFFVTKIKKTGDAVPARMDPPKTRDLYIIKHDHKNIKSHLDRLSEYYGIEREEFARFKYFIKGKDVYCIDKDWQGENLGVFLRIGRKFGLIDKRNICHFSPHSVQLFNNKVNSNIIELNDFKDLKSYFDGGTVRKVFEPFGQKIISYRGKLMGTAIAFQDGLKSQFPRAMRTSEIIFPDGEVIKDKSAPDANPAPSKEE